MPRLRSQAQASLNRRRSHEQDVAQVKLGEVLQHRKEFITIDDLTTYERPRVQLHVQGIVLRDEVPGALIKTKTQQLCRTGEFLVAEIDAKVGGFGIVLAPLDGSIVSSHYFLFAIDGAKLDWRFLDFFIRTPAFRDQVAAQGSTNYAAIRPSHVLGYEIPLPPLREQRRIVARIEELAAQIQEARTESLAAAQAFVISAHATLSFQAREQGNSLRFSYWMRMRCLHPAHAGASRDAVSAGEGLRRNAGKPRGVAARDAAHI